jgi:arylsulfatase A-like enzyme
MSRPNILLISADQHRADCFGFMGRKVKTPHLDRLASEGTYFTNCITPCVVCQPARASILTGQLCRRHGVHDNDVDLDPAIGAKGFAGEIKQRFLAKPIFRLFTRLKPLARRSVLSPRHVIRMIGTALTWGFSMRK